MKNAIALVMSAVISCILLSSFCAWLLAANSTLEDRVRALEDKLTSSTFTISGKGGRITLMAGETSGIWITGPGGSSVPQVAIWRNDKVAALGTYGANSKFAACASALNSNGTLQLEAGQDDFRFLRGSDLKKGYR